MKSEVLDENMTAYKLANLDVKSPKQINIGNGARLAFEQSEATGSHELLLKDVSCCCYQVAGKVSSEVFTPTCF